MARTSQVDSRRLGDRSGSNNESWIEEYCISKRTVIHLGVMTDVKLSLRQHLDYAYQKEACVTVTYAKKLPNVGGS